MRRLWGKAASSQAGYSVSPLSQKAGTPSEKGPRLFKALINPATSEPTLDRESRELQNSKSILDPETFDLIRKFVGSEDQVPLGNSFGSGNS